MAKYQMEDGFVVDTNQAQQQWREDTRWDGHNHVSVATGSQWEHERLCRSKRGRYYLEHWSDYQGVAPWAQWIAREHAARWLLLNNHDLPPDLAEMADKLID